MNKKDLAKGGRYYQSMLDLNSIEKGEIYRDLKDGTSKIFFNTKDYYKESEENIKSFLEYVEEDKINENFFVRKLEQKIKNIKENKEWEASYMKSLLREQEIARDNFEKGKIEGIAEGVTKGREEGIKNLVDTCIELGMDKEFIVKKLVEKYKLGEEEVYEKNK